MKSKLLICLVIVFSGCSSWNYFVKCDSESLKKLGKNDGLLGHTNRTEETQSLAKCGDKNLQANSDYEIGYREGLKQYCTPAVIQYVAENGGLYKEGFCSRVPDANEALLLAVYKKNFNPYVRGNFSGGSTPYSNLGVMGYYRCETDSDCIPRLSGVMFGGCVPTTGGWYPYTYCYKSARCTLGRCEWYN